MKEQYLNNGGIKTTSPNNDDKPTFLRQREWEYVLALYENGGDYRLAAHLLGVRPHAVENMVSKIRKKLDDATKFRRSKYMKYIKRKR